MKVKLSPRFVVAITLAVALSPNLLRAQSTNLIDVQIAGSYGGNSSTNTSGAAVLGSSGDVWNEYGGSSGFPGTFPSALALNFVNGSTASGASFAVSMTGATYVGTLPQGAAPGFTATTGAPNTNIANLYSGTTEGFSPGSPSAIFHAIFTFSSLTAYIGDTFIYDVYYGSQGTASSLTGATGGNTGSSLTATAADANINNAFNTNTGAGDSYVQYTGTISGSTLTFNATMPAANVGGNGWGGCLVGSQLQLINTNLPPSSFLWSNAPASSNWATAANWAGGSVPSTGTALVFSASTITGLNNNIVGATNASLTFSNNAPAYTIGGNTLTLTTGIYNSSTNTQTINLPIANPSGISLATTNGGGNLVISGPISGAGGVTASGTGTTTLNATNTYSGSTAVSGGSFVLSGSLTNSSVSVTGGTFSESSGGSIAGTGGFSQSGSSISTLAGTNTFTGATTVSGGSLTVSSSLNGSALTVSGGTAIVSGALTNSSVSVTSGSLALSGSLSGSGGVSVSGGSAVLSGNNTNNTGNFNLTGGTLTLQANSNNTVGGISYALSKEGVATASFDNAATLKLLSDSNVTFAGGNNLGPVGGYQTQNYFVDQLTSGNSNKTITFAPGGIIVAYTTINVSGSNDGYTLALGNLTGVAGDGPATSLNANGANLQIGSFSGNTLAVGGSNNTTITGGITSGVDTLTKSGTGTLTLSGSVNTYSGATTISGGAVQLTGSATLGSSGSYSQAITDNGQLIYGSSANQTLGGVISGSGGLTDSGAGSLTLNAADTFTGTTAIGSSAHLLLGSSGSAASTNIALTSGTFDVSSQAAYALSTNQSLTGSGFVNAGAGTLTLNGKLTPGSGGTRGLIALTGGLKLGSTSTTTFTLTSSGTAGVNYDAASATGTLTYNGILDLVVNTPSVGTFNLFGAGAFTGDFNSVALTGSWNPGSFTETSGVWNYSDPGNTYDFAFTPSSGVLTVMVPEPSTWALFGVAMFCGLVVRRSIKRRQA